MPYAGIGDGSWEMGAVSWGAPFMRPHVEGPWAACMQMASRRRPLELHLHLHLRPQLQLQLRLATFRTIFHAT